jgi:hypothetical protein
VCVCARACEILSYTKRSEMKDLIVIALQLCFKICYEDDTLYLSSDCYLSATLVPTFADRGVLHSQHGGSLRP